MRTSSTFTDGRIHVTLCDGAFDLKALNVTQRAIYTELLDLYERDCEAAALREAIAARMSVGAAHKGDFDVLAGDFVARITLAQKHGGDASFTDHLPTWRADAMRAYVQSNLA